MSISTLENIVEMLNSLLLEERVSTTGITRVFEEINKLNILMSRWCSLSGEPFTQEACSKFNEIMSRLIETSMKSIIVRSMNNEVTFGQDTLGSTLSTLTRIINVFRDIVLKSIVVYDGKVLCKVKKAFYGQYSTMAPGYVTLIPIEKAVMLASLDYIDIIDVY